MQQQHEYEVLSKLWFFEEQYYKGEDYCLKDDPEYISWAEDRRKEDLQNQINSDAKKRS